MAESKALDERGHFTGGAAQELLEEIERRMAGYANNLDGTSVGRIKEVLRLAEGKPAERVLCEAMRELLLNSIHVLSDTPKGLRSACIALDLRGDGGAHVFVLAQAAAYTRAASALLRTAEEQIGVFLAQDDKATPAPAEVS